MKLTLCTQRKKIITVPLDILSSVFPLDILSSVFPLDILSSVFD